MDLLLRCPVIGPFLGKGDLHRDFYDMGLLPSPYACLCALFGKVRRQESGTTGQSDRDESELPISTAFCAVVIASERGEDAQEVQTQFSSASSLSPVPFSNDERETDDDRHERREKRARFASSTNKLIYFWLLLLTFSAKNWRIA